MTTNPLVSVIIPLYNRVELALKAIESALNQTYKPLEVIVVDDGSSDESFSRISSIKATNLKLFRHKKNKGANAARNTGLKNAKGSWIAFLDSDDTWNFKKIEIMMSKTRTKNRNYDFIYCGMKLIDNNKVKAIYEAHNKDDVYASLLYNNFIGSTSVPIIKKNLLKKVQGFDEQLSSAQDWDLWLRIAKENCSFLAVNIPLVNYTIPNSENHISSSFDSFFEGRKQFIQKHLDKYTGANRKALSKVYSDTAFLLLKRFNEPKKARSWFYKSTRYNLFLLKPWKGILATIIPPYFRQKLL